MKNKGIPDCSQKNRVVMLLSVKQNFFGPENGVSWKLITIGQCRVRQGIRRYIRMIFHGIEESSIAMEPGKLLNMY